MVRTTAARGSSAPQSILIVEDEPSDSISLRYSLEAGGYVVTLAKSIAEALRMVAAKAPDLVLLDLVLPDGSGLDLCRQVRSIARRTVIVVLSARAEEADRVASFEVGADDFVTKPFSIGELLLRLQARLNGGGKSTRQPAIPPKPSANDGPASQLVIGPLRIEKASHRAFLGQRELALSAQEMRLLTFLASEPNKLHTRRDLFTAVWGYHPDATSRTLDTHIKRLRDKFGTFASMIQTIHGVGYRFAPSPRQLEESTASKRRR